MQLLEGLQPGLWLWVCHIGIDSPEQRALIHSEPKDIFVEGGVGRHRAEELNVVTSLEVRSAILKKGIILTNYRELWKQRRQATLARLRLRPTRHVAALSSPQRRKGPRGGAEKS